MCLSGMHSGRPVIENRTLHLQTCRNLFSLIANVPEEVSLGRWFNNAKVGGVATGIRLLVLQLQEA